LFSTWLVNGVSGARLINPDPLSVQSDSCGVGMVSSGGVFNLSEHCLLEAFVAVIADKLGSCTTSLEVKAAGTAGTMALAGIWVDTGRGVPLTHPELMP